MRFLSTAAAFLAASLPLASAFHKGFNIAAERPDGSCKSAADWNFSFQTMKNLPGGFRDVRVFASSDCNTLANAVPAAISNGIQLLVGVWTVDAAHYGREKAALLSAMRTHGVGWISAVSVGSETLYRGDEPASSLAGKIYDVRGMMGANGGKGIWVGHVDTWTAWVNGANAAVIKACDFVGMDAYPYYQGAAIGNARQTFYSALSATENAVAKNKPGTPVWVTETGHPVKGANFGASVASPANARTYWQQVFCSVFPTRSTYWFDLRDYQASPSFGVLDINFRPIFNLAC